MGETRSTSALTVEDLEKKPRKSIELIMPLKNVDVRYGGACELSMQGNEISYSSKTFLKFKKSFN